MKLVDDWKDWWRWWSLRLAALGTAITSVMIAYPDAALSAWNILPEDIKATLPPDYIALIGVGIFACSMVARVVKQEKE